MRDAPGYAVYASSAKKRPIRHRPKPISARGLKNADFRADFFFIGNVLSVFSGRGSDITGATKRLSRFFSHELPQKAQLDSVATGLLGTPTPSAKAGGH